VRSLPYCSDSAVWVESIRSLGCTVWLDSADSAAARSCSGAAASSSRYDIITAAPETLIQLRAGRVTVRDMNTQVSVSRSEGDLFALLEEQMAWPRCVAQGTLPFCGGLLGYWGYELNQYLEPKRIRPGSGAHPDLMVGLYLWGIIVDHHLEKTELFLHPDLPGGKREEILAALDRRESTGFCGASDNSFVLREAFRPCLSRKDYEDAFSVVKTCIAAGDCYQINLTQRFDARYAGDSLQAYRWLRAVSPAPFSVYIEFPGLSVLSHSPERFLFSQANHVEARPIKGTRPRLEDAAQDQASKDSLRNSEKDRAENLMIVDLLRNDLARNCRPGSIRVPSLFQLETFANVHHLVSTVTGQLAPGRSNLNLLRDAFPGGSVTGAPKVRAMEIIREIELCPRSVYCGAIGYLSLHGRMDVNIPIRTLVATGEGALHTWGGGAIVDDSRCDDEYEESLLKVRNLMQGLEDRFLEPEK